MRGVGLSGLTEQLFGRDQQVSDRLFDLRQLLLGLNFARGSAWRGMSGHRVVAARLGILTFLGVRRDDP